MTRLQTLLTRTAIAGVAAATLGACAQTPMPETAANRHTIQVAESIERLEIYPREDGLALSSRDRDAMNLFLAGYRDQGSGPVYLNRPQASSGGIDSARTQVRQAMSGLGMQSVGIQEGSYQTLPGAPAPLVVSYRRLKTLVPTCNPSADDLTATFYNTPTPNWGCAYHANIAAMVADPNQFLSPYELGEADPRRRMIVYDKYINGQPTAARRDTEQEISSQDPRAQ